MEAVYWMRMEGQDEVCPGDLPAVFRFRMEESLSGGRKICMKERKWEDVERSQADSYVDKILTAFNLKGRLYSSYQLS
jgi:hypothetical protein